VVGHLGSSELRNSTNHEGINIGAIGSIAERQKMDLTLSSIPSLLHMEDRNSMAHSVETRLPFLDYKLVEFAVNCPTSFKLRDGWSKWILRRVMKGILPDAIRLRKSKLAFTVPQKCWMLDGLSNGHRDIWEGPALRMTRFLDPHRLACETRRFLSTGRSALSPDSLFRAISLELWARIHNVS
jgi:asparagine synthase (glutamine-hydrolysing)